MQIITWEEGTESDYVLIKDTKTGNSVKIECNVGEALDLCNLIVDNSKAVKG